jgi:hypothetical protein
MAKQSRHGTLGHVVRGLLKVAAVVLIWRGIWHGMDALDVLVFGGSHAWTALGGAVIGFLILYLPDHDIREVMP